MHGCGHVNSVSLAGSKARQCTKRWKQGKRRGFGWGAANHTSREPRPHRAIWRGQRSDDSGLEEVEVIADATGVVGDRVCARARGTPTLARAPSRRHIPGVARARPDIGPISYSGGATQRGRRLTVAKQERWKGKRRGKSFGWRPAGWEGILCWGTRPCGGGVP